MFEDIIGTPEKKQTKKKVHGHWGRCQSCGIVFDKEEYDSCPICQGYSNAGFKPMDIDEIKKALDRIRGIQDV